MNPSSRLRLALALVAILAACGLPRTSHERQIERLRADIGSTPLDENAAERLSAEKAALDQLTVEITRRARNRENARLDWQAGECQRLRHLFDEVGAWEEAERHLTLALARDPQLTKARVSLGQLYLAGGFAHAPRAEQEFVRALEAAGGKPLPEARRGLFLAYYYQGRWAEAIAEADRYLAVSEQDVDVRKMRAMAEANLARKNRE